MPNTALGTPYIVSTDLVANYPTVSSDLADHIDEVSVNSFANASARSTAIPTPIEGQVSYLEDINIVEAYTGAAWNPVSKILQIVRATDSTSRATTSTTYVDVTGASVTITPKKNDSAILLICTGLSQGQASSATEFFSFFQLTDNSNNLVSGGGPARNGLRSGTSVAASMFMQYSFTLIGYSTPATLNATTYKLRFRVNGAGETITMRNDEQTMQLYAIEVSA